MSDADKIKQLERLLNEALDWLNDYGLRMAGSADLADRIEKALSNETATL